MKILKQKSIRNLTSNSRMISRKRIKAKKLKLKIIKKAIEKEND